MIIALLFDWSAYPESGNYWHAIRNVVFGTGILQRSDRHMKLAIGDVLVGLEAGQDPEALFNAAFNNSDWTLLDGNRVNEGFPTIFGMVFENMPRALSQELHEALVTHNGYVGTLSVHLEYPPHLALYRGRLPPQFRLRGTRLRSFYAMGNMDGCDPEELTDMRRLGYSDAEFEDTGMSRTILDDFDTPRHFARVAAFRDVLLTALAEDDAYELSMLLEDLSPKLFNALGAAAERLADAENEEDLAQVALSARRYMEQLADELFPPTDAKRNGRKLDKPSYKNRLWAFAEDAISNEPSRLLEIGGNIDRVFNEANAGVHSDRAKAQVSAVLINAAKVTITLFSLTPDAIRNGYRAYADSLRLFVRDLARPDCASR